MSEFVHTDPKREFLERLQSLLREFDAKIECWQSDFAQVAMAIHLGDKITIEQNSGDRDNAISITADNIMDFDKE